MNLNWIALAIPVFILFIVIEYYAAKRQGQKFHDLENSVSNLSVGIAERLLDIFVVGWFYYFYDYLNSNFAIFDIRASLLLWVLLFICTDFVWYWYHRMAHEINLFWAAHIVHHQSEDLNYTVSARITVFQAFIRTGFWSVLPVIGFPAEMITSVLLVHGAYPFFIHTRTIGKLGVLEYIFVTPSHHRVHHAANDIYLDKNYGDVLIIWDKIFGTFQEEKIDVEIRYGLTHPLKSHSFLWQHFHFFAELFFAVYHARGLKKKWNLLFGKPETLSPGIREKIEPWFISQSAPQSKQDKPLNRYVAIQVILSILALFVFTLFEHYIDLDAQLVITLFILLTLINCGAILEQRKWIFYLELLRIAIVLIPITHLLNSLSLMLFTLLLFGILAFKRKPFQRQYFMLIYGREIL